MRHSYDGNDTRHTVFTMNLSNQKPTGMSIFTAYTRQQSKPSSCTGKFSSLKAKQQFSILTSI